MSAELGPREISVSLQALSGDDWLKLRRIACSHLHGTSLRDLDLVNEAVTRSLLGKRKCPRGVAVMAFLAQTMRSIATHDRQRCAKLVHSDVEAASAATSSAAPVGVYVSSPEEALIEKETAAAAVTIDDMREVMKEDAEALRVLDGVSQELKGRALRDFAGLDQYRFDYAKTRIRKAMQARHPRGRT